MTAELVARIYALEQQVGEASRLLEGIADDARDLSALMAREAELVRLAPALMAREAELVRLARQARAALLSKAAPWAPCGPADAWLGRDLPTGERAAVVLPLADGWMWRVFFPDAAAEGGATTRDSACAVADAALASGHP